MPQFRDNRAESWSIDLDYARLKEIRSRLGIDLLALDNRQQISRLVEDQYLLVDVLYLACAAQCAERGVSDEEFGRRLIGDPIDEASFALLEGLSNFFPSRKRALIQGALATLRDTNERLLSRTEQLVREGMFSDLITQAERAYESHLHEVAGTKFSAAGPASPASIPIGTPPAS